MVKFASLSLAFVALLAVSQALTCDEFLKLQGNTWSDTSARVIESPHPYCNNTNVTQTYKFTSPDVTSVNVTWDSQSDTENGYDYVTFTYTNSQGEDVQKSFNGTITMDFTIDATEFKLNFYSDVSVVDYGYKFTAQPLYPCKDYVTTPLVEFDSLGMKTIESPHPYCNNLHHTTTYHDTTFWMRCFEVTWDPLSVTEDGYDYITIDYTNHDDQAVSLRFTGDNFYPITIDAVKFDLTFHSDYSINKYGFKMNAEARSWCTNDAVKTEEEADQAKAAVKKVAAMFKPSSKEE